MKVVIQRVKHAHIIINNHSEKEISHGVVIFLGITHSDSKNEADFLVEKIVNLRIFDDEQGVMNRSLIDCKGDLMVVSQFTLYGSALKGRRPSYIEAAKPEIAIPLYDYFIEKMEKFNLNMVTGEFGADMQVSLQNDGPVTLIIEK